MFLKALSGSRLYYAWLGFLGTLFLLGLIFYLRQFFLGLQVTDMGRDVSWGLYLANFTFLVGVAASAVMVVLPYYVHHYKQFRRITTLGEFIAIPAVLMCIMFVMIDLGQPTRFVNLFLHPSPRSILFFDIVVLTGYLVLNLVIGFMVLNARRKDEAPKPWLKSIIYLSIPWAISIHTVTAFIYAGLAARPYWLTALMAPRFLASAFAAGPALLIIGCLILRRYTTFDPGKEAIQKIAQIVTYALLATIFFFLVEAFTILYSDIPGHKEHFWYLLTGWEGKSGLVPWTWTTFIFWLAAVVLLIRPSTRGNEKTLLLALGMVFISMWIDKGLVLMVPGFFPSPTGELVEYTPTANEWLVTLGVWAFGFLVMTILYKIGTSVMKDIGEDKPSPEKDFSSPNIEVAEEKSVPSSNAPGADTATLVPLASEE
ncbi:MAG: polysulfide reductase NrfD [Dehalococcoidia bacterium]|nr:MAG: polysulfide reductase NrfD [Dehalococcoidia bacterium]